MWYKVNWNVLVLHLLPIRLRKASITMFIQTLVKPIVTTSYLWEQWRLENLYKIQHSGQVCYLRKSLNDKFDIDERRIYIGDGQVHNTLYIYTEAEAQNVYLHTQSEESTLYLRTEAETADTGLDFIVFVPHEIYQSQLHALHAHIKFYKVGGKRYSIFISNE